MRGLRGLVVAALVVAAVTIGVRPSAAAPSPPKLVTITIPARSGEIPSKWLGYGGPPRANVLLPAGYDPHRQYPLLVLLHGLNCNSDWYRQVGLTKLFEGLDAIVVMPEGGSGWYTDWWNDGARGDPAWESYELDEVLPTILARYPIRRERRYHAIAGISMGGMGAPYLGGRLPGFFGSVAAISGFVDPRWNASLVAPAMGFTSLAWAKGNLNPSPVVGPANGFYMAGHNPTDLVVNLRQTRVFVTTGTGDPSRAAAYNVPGSASEGQIIYPMNRLYRVALLKAGVDVTYRSQPGGHDIADFANELRAYLAWGPFQPVETAPRSWVNRTVATTGKLWDLTYAFSRPPDRVAELRRDGDVLTLGPAGANVTLVTDGGCVVHAHTPSKVRLPTGPCPR
jgi:S-formylglutathione hydrolase FrmB